jgi:hypothetical protein
MNQYVSNSGSVKYLILHLIYLLQKKSEKHILRDSLEADSCLAFKYYLFNYGPGIKSTSNIDEYQESS